MVLSEEVIQSASEYLARFLWDAMQPSGKRDNPPTSRKGNEHGFDPSK